MNRYIPIVGLAFILAGCATPPAPEQKPYFTDTELHDACDGDQGCVLVPGDVWQTIANMLQGKDA